MHLDIHCFIPKLEVIVSKENALWRNYMMGFLFWESRVLAWQASVKTGLKVICKLGSRHHDPSYREVCPWPWKWLGVGRGDARYCEYSGSRTLACSKEAPSSPEGFLTASPQVFFPALPDGLPHTISSLGSPIQLSKEIATLWKKRSTYFFFLFRLTSKQSIGLIKHKWPACSLPTPKLTSVFSSVGQFHSYSVYTLGHHIEFIWTSKCSIEIQASKWYAITLFLLQASVT